MAVTAYVFNKFKQKKISEVDAIDFDADTIKVLLTTSSYVPNLDTHEFRSDVTNEVSAGGGYSTGGITLSNKTVGLDTAGDFGYLDADDVTWTTATFTCRIAVVYKDTGVAGTSPLVGWIDFGADQVNTGGNFTIQWATPANGGVLKLS
jgi:hypothetical protein